MKKITKAFSIDQQVYNNLKEYATSKERSVSWIVNSFLKILERDKKNKLKKKAI